LKLSEGFFVDHVRPLIEQGFPNLQYSAALIGSGSEVLGFDTPMSTDHHWGPRVLLFLRAEDHSARQEDIRYWLAHNLPSSYRGWSTHFAPPDPNDNGVQHLAKHEAGPINHRVELYTIDGFFLSYMDLAVSEPMTTAAWLSLPSQKLRSIVSGGVFHDDLGLKAVRDQLAWYPQDVWLYILGCLWTRISQEEHLMGRAGSVEDEMGSALIGTRLVRDIMRIAFYLEREYPPYPKWFGTAFERLRCASRLRPNLQAALQARNWQERERGLSAACETLLQIQRAAGIADDHSGYVSPFWERPFLVIHAEKIAQAIFDRISVPELSSLGQNTRIGSIDLIADNTDVLENTGLYPSIRSIFSQCAKGSPA